MSLAHTTFFFVFSQTKLKSDSMLHKEATKKSFSLRPLVPPPSA